MLQTVDSWWDQIKKEVDNVMKTGYVISLPVICRHKTNLIRCFVCPVYEDVDGLFIGRHTRWVELDLNVGLVHYDCRVRDFYHGLENNTRYNCGMCKNDGYDALQDCLASLAVLTASPINVDSENEYSHTYVNISQEQAESYNNKVLKYTSPEFMDVYIKLIKE